MGFGVNRNINALYANWTTIFFVVLTLLFISIDSINRYFLLLSLEDLENSQIYSALRIVLFGFLLVVFFCDRKRLKATVFHVLYLFAFLAFVSCILNSTNIDELIKSTIYAFTFILIFRFGVLLGVLNTNIQPTIIFILFGVGFILAKFFQVYILRFGQIYIISNDAIFSLVVFVPFLYFLKSRKVIFLAFLLISLCTLFSQKRSAIVFVNLGLAVSMFVYFKESSRRFFIVGISILVFALAFLYRVWGQSDFLTSASNRFTNIGDSGRSEIANNALSQYLDADMINLLFGFGFRATVARNGVPSHNDFLEIVYDFGIFSLFLYVIVIVILGVKCIIWYRNRSKYIGSYSSFVMAYIMLIGFSLFNSMVFSEYHIVLFFALGLSYGQMSFAKVK